MAKRMNYQIALSRQTREGASYGFITIGYKGDDENFVSTAPDEKGKEVIEMVRGLARLLKPTKEIKIKLEVELD